MRYILPVQRYICSPWKDSCFPELCHNCGGCDIVALKKRSLRRSIKFGTLNFGAIDGITIVYSKLEVRKPLAVPVIKAVKNQIWDDENIIWFSAWNLMPLCRDSKWQRLLPPYYRAHSLRFTWFKNGCWGFTKISVPFGVVVNRADIGDRKLYDYYKEDNIRIMLEIPYDRKDSRTVF